MCVCGGCRGGMAVWRGDQEERRQQEEQRKKDEREKIDDLRRQLADTESKLSSSRVFGKDTSGGVIASNHHEDIKFRSADGQRLLRYSCNEAHIGLAMQEVLGRPVFSVSEDSDGNVFVRINVSGACVGSRVLPLCRPRPLLSPPRPFGSSFSSRSRAPLSRRSHSQPDDAYETLIPSIVVLGRRRVFAGTERPYHAK